MQMDADNGPDKQARKLSGFQFWRESLHCAKYVVAPMVDQSELAWRMFSRRHGAQLCYTPMFHAAVFVKDPNYRRESMQVCAEDRPLIVQFCANDPDTLLEAAKYVEGQCDAVDLNLGCPQVIARKGHYGAFLQDEWDLIEKMVSTCHQKLQVPITCKIRVFQSKERTVQYARMLERAGCQLLTVHGRTREQKGKETGCADWSYIKAVREAVTIPVFANGNIQYLPDVHHCLKETGVQGVMSAEGNLHNPALFTGQSPNVWDMVFEYLEFVEKYPCPTGYTRGHFFKLCVHALTVHRNVRDMVASAKCLDDFREAAHLLKELCTVDMAGAKSDPELLKRNMPIDLPYWICQPYVRPKTEADRAPDHHIVRQMINLKRAREVEKIRAEHGELSMNKIKKRLKNPYKNYDIDRSRKFEACVRCTNPKGTKCEHSLCKACCRTKVHTERRSCLGHNFKPKPGLAKEECAAVVTPASQAEAPTDEGRLSAEPGEDKESVSQGERVSLTSEASVTPTHPSVEARPGPPGPPTHLDVIDGDELQSRAADSS